MVRATHRLKKEFVLPKVLKKMSPTMSNETIVLKSKKKTVLDQNAMRERLESNEM